MIKINNAIIHILNFNPNLLICSEQELDIESKSVLTFLTKHIEKALVDPDLKSGAFKENSGFKNLMDAYLKKELTFISFPTSIGETTHSAISKSDKLASLDLIVCDFNLDTDRLIGIFQCVNRIGFTHQVSKNSGIMTIDLINHHALLPTPAQKLDEFAFINPYSYDIKFLDKKRYIDGRDTYIIPDTLLECNFGISSKEAIRLVNSITRAVSENHGQSSVLAISKVKNYIVENMEISEYVEPKEIGKQVFNSSPVMQQEFIKEVETAGIPEVVKLDRNFAKRTGKNHKIKTDTGIEISIPADYFQNKDFVEITNNPDGTLSIQLKNIGKITNKLS